MPEPVTNELIYELLKRLQDGQARIESRLASLEDRLREQGGQIAHLARSYADLMEAGLRRDHDHTDLQRRVERIERRLDLTDPPA